MKFKDYLKEERKNAHLSQAKLAKMVGITQQTLAQYEKGVNLPKHNTLMKILEALNAGKPIFEIPELEDYYRIEVPPQVMYAKDFQDAKDVSSRRSTIDDDEFALISAYRKLNKTGKSEAVKRVKELTEINNYTKED